MKRILFLLEDLRFGGVEMSLINLVNALSDCEITILTWGKKFDLLSKIKNKDVNIKRVSYFFTNLIYLILKTFIKDKKAEMYKNWIIKLIIRSHISLKHYDIIINYHYKNNASLLRTVKKLGNYIAWYHSSNYYDYHFQDKFIDKYKKIIVVNDKCADVICAQKPDIKDKLFVIENLSPYKEIKSKSEMGEDLFDKKYFNIVTCARLHEEKGIDTAIEACKILKDKISEFKWYVVGDAAEDSKDYKKYIKNTIKNYSLDNELILLGGKQNPYPYFAQCDLYVQPSREESFGITIAEAQICGATVISTETVGAQLLIKDGETGIITDNNAIAIANAMLELYGNAEKRNYLSENAKKIDFEDSNKEIINKFYKLIGVATDNE